MNDLGKAFIEFREKYDRMCITYPDCEFCPIRRYDLKCDLNALTEEEAEIVANWAPPVTTETPRDTPVLVRDYNDEAWREAYLCAKLKDTVIVYTDTEDGKHTMCKSDKANSVRRFKQCKLR